MLPPNQVGHFYFAERRTFLLGCNTALTGWLDYVLFPLLFLCLAVVVQALWLRAGRPGPAPKLWATAIAAALSVLFIWIEFRFALRITLGVFVAVGIYAFFLSRMTSNRATQ
tara:strand:+ start:1850 stop:2185 length:336 start_codon:yes stop_codon:yes gene_type:complete